MIRVFPRKTNATPVDELAFYGGPPLWWVGDHPVSVSCTFTYDKRRSEFLAKQWEKAGYEVSVGGPAFGDKGGEFVPGRFVKHGMTMTSRGCNNKCWFCYVPKREGVIRELPIIDGWNVLDSNLLQCTEQHIRKVFTMLKRQKERITFTGGLEATQLKDWHVALLTDLKPKRLYFAYDKADEYEPLAKAAEKMFNGGFTKTSHSVLCYVLIGYPKDTFGAAEKRLRQVLDLGMTPMAMLYRNDKGETQQQWRAFQKRWVRPWIIYATKERKC